MKKTVAVLMTVLTLFLLVGCGSKATISAKDYVTRLDNMSLQMSARELSEISTMLIGCPIKDFDDLNGWYTDKDVLDREILCKKTMLGGYSVIVELGIEGKNVSNVEYKYENLVWTDYVHYVKFDLVAGTPMTINITREGEDGSTEFEEVSEEEMIDYVTEKLLSQKKFSFYCDWDYTNGDETDARISFSFSCYPSVIAGDVFFMSVRYRLAT